MKMQNSEIFIRQKDIAPETVGQGVQRKILGYDQNLMMVSVDFKKDSIGPLHAHPHTQVTYIISGSFDVQIGAEKKTLRGGDCYFIPPNIEHGVVALEDSALVDVFTPVREDFIAPKTK
jgi:quercetin dioxygenase-like cupin family protein